MHRFASILLLLLFSLLATGIPQALHQRDHEREDARELAESKNQNPSQPLHHHSHDDCPTCAQFHAPLFSQSSTAWLIDTGIWVAFISMLPVNQHLQVLPTRLTARGPPASA